MAHTARLLELPGAHGQTHILYVEQNTIDLKLQELTMKFIQHEWLVTHGIIKSDHPKLRSELVTRMGAFYYHPLDSVYSTWSESQLRQWLINHGIIKSDVQMKKDKLLRLVE